MAPPKTSSKPKPNRSTDAAILVRCMEDDLKLLRQAAAVQERDLQRTVPGAKVPVYAFVLSVALERARDVVRKARG